jgi:hypothetical protein
MVALIEQLRSLTDRYLYLHLDVIGDVEHTTRSTVRSWRPCAGATPPRWPN